MPQTSTTAAIPAKDTLASEAMPRPGRNEWLLVLFTAMTNLADAVARVSLPLLAASLTRSPALVAGVATMITLPWLVTALHVGVYVDRFNRRNLMMGAELARLGAIVIIVAAYLMQMATLPLIYVVAAVLGVEDVVALTAGAAIVPSAVPKRRWQLASARITAMEYLFNGFVGAPVGGFLAAAGMALALGSTGLVYIVGIALLALLVGNFTPKAPEQRRSVHLEIREGLTFLWRHRLLRTMALLIAVMAGCWAAWLAVLPVYATSPGPLGLDARGFGLLLTCLGAGGVTGTLLVGPVNRLVGRRWSMFADILGSLSLVAVPALMPAAPSSTWAVGAAAFAAGLGGTMWTVNSRVIIQSLVPDHMLGRFSAASRLVGWGSAPVATIIAGLIAQFAGYRAAFGTFAVICAALIIPYLRIVTADAIAEVDRQ